MANFGGTLQDLKRLRDFILLRKAVCPFISSTFQDFSVERDYLVKKVFPLLDALCQQRGTYFAYVDLRWGITSEQQDRGELLRLCLDYVHENLPFFIGLLGERYGSHRDPSTCERLTPHTVYDPSKHNWLDRAYLAASADYDWLLEDDHQYASITELEITQAIFKDHAEHALFYFRKSPSTEVESEYARKRLAELKVRLVNAGCSVKYFESTKQLCTFLHDDFKCIIDTLYPPIYDYIAPLGTAGDAQVTKSAWREWATQELYAETRRRVFVRTNQICGLSSLLDQFVRSVRSNAGPPRATTLTRSSGVPPGVQRHASVPYGLQQPLAVPQHAPSHRSPANEPPPTLTGLPPTLKHKQLSSTTRTLVELLNPPSSMAAQNDYTASRRLPRTSCKAYSEQEGSSTPPTMMTYSHGMTSLPTGVTLDDASECARFVETDAILQPLYKLNASASALSNSTSLSASLNCAASPSGAAQQPLSIGAASVSLLDASILVLSGERGVGKTSILANWLAQFASDDDAFPLLLARSNSSQPSSPGCGGAFSSTPSAPHMASSTSLASVSSDSSGVAPSRPTAAAPSRPHSHRAAVKQLSHCISRTLTRVFTINTTESVRIFTHYVGSTAQSKSIADFLQRIVAELRRDREPSPVDLATTIIENESGAEMDSGRGASTRSRLHGNAERDSVAAGDLSQRVAELEQNAFAPGADGHAALNGTSAPTEHVGAAANNPLPLHRIGERCFEAIRACRQRCVLVIDALDELSDGDATSPLGSTACVRAKELGWLPSRLPANCKVIVTTTRSDATLKVLRNRVDTRIVTIEQPLDDATKRCIIQKHLCSHYKVLTDAQLTRICEAKMSSLPLFLVLLTNELRQFGPPDGAATPLDRHLENYLEATSIRELWRKIIERWNTDYDSAMRPRVPLVQQHKSISQSHGSPARTQAAVPPDRQHNRHAQIAVLPSDAVSPDEQDEPPSPDDYPVYTMRYAREHAYVLDANAKIKFKPLKGWVCDALRLIAVSRYGLTDRDLLSLLRDQLGHAWVTQYDWLLLRNVANEFLYESAHGLLRFCHEHLQEAIEYDLLGYMRAPPPSTSASTCPSRASPVHGDASAMRMASAGTAPYSPNGSRRNPTTPSPPGAAPTTPSTMFTKFHSHMADFLWRLERDAVSLRADRHQSESSSSANASRPADGNHETPTTSSTTGDVGDLQSETRSNGNESDGTASHAQHGRRRTSELLYHLFRAERYGDLYDVLTEPNTIVYLIAILSRDHTVSLSAAHHRFEHLALPTDFTGGASSFAEDAGTLKHDITLYWCTLLAQNYPINRAYYDLTIRLCRQCPRCRLALGLAVEQALQAYAAVDPIVSTNSAAQSQQSTTTLHDLQSPLTSFARPDSALRDPAAATDSTTDMLSVEEATATAACSMSRLDVPSSRSMWNFVKSVSDAEIELTKTNGDCSPLPSNTDDSRLFLQLIANAERRTRAVSISAPTVDGQSVPPRDDAQPNSVRRASSCTHTVGMYELSCIQVGILLGGLGHFLSEIDRFLSSQSLLLIAYNIFVEQLTYRDFERSVAPRNPDGVADSSGYSTTAFDTPRIHLDNQPNEQHLDSSDLNALLTTGDLENQLAHPHPHPHPSSNSPSSRPDERERAVSSASASSADTVEIISDCERRNNCESANNERSVVRRQKISVQMNRRSRSSMLEHQTIKWYVCGVEECLGNMHTEQLAHTAAERWYKQALRTNSEYIDYLQFEKKYLDSTAELDFDGDESTSRLIDAVLAHPSAADAGNVFQKAYETRMRLLNKLASLYVYNKRFAEAEQLLRDAISAALHCSFSGEKATIVYNVGLLRRKQGMLDEAEKHLRIALQWREAWFGKSHLCVSEVLLQLAAVLTQSRSHTDSHAMSRPPPYGQSHAHARTHTHSRPSSAMSEPRSHDKFLAESYLRRALSVRLDALGPEHLHVATAQFHLALLLAGQPSRMLKEEARDLLRSGIDTRTKLLGSDHKQTLHMCEKLRALELELRQFSPCASKLQLDALVTRDRSNTFLSPARMSCPGQTPTALHTAHVQSPSSVVLTSRRATPTYAHSSRSARNSVSRPDDLPVVSVNVSQHSGGFKTRTHVVGVSKQLLVNGDTRLRDIRGADRTSKARKHSQAVQQLGLSPAHVAVPRRSASARRLYHDFSQRSSSDEELFIEQPLSGNTVTAAVRVKVPIAGTRHADSSPEETSKATASSGHEYSRRRDGFVSAQSNRKWSAVESQAGVQETDTSVPNASGPERRSSWLRKRREKAIVSTEMQHGHAPFAAQQSEC